MDSQKQFPQQFSFEFFPPKSPEGSEKLKQVRDQLGADAILVFAITEYRPYAPPIVGISAQLFGDYADDANAGLDPVRVSRSASAVSTRSMSLTRRLGR